MFSGIIEAQSRLIKKWSSDQALRLLVERPVEFNDLKIGDSICTNGVCLTIELFTATEIQFCLGAETLHILANSLSRWETQPINLERSLKFGDRVHGHLVTGHVDILGKVIRSEADGECWQLQVEIQPPVSRFFWKKGSVGLNGVSLTVNDVQSLSQQAIIISVCLIPETIKKTNLSFLKVNDYVPIEADYLAKAYFQSRERDTL